MQAYLHEANVSEIVVAGEVAEGRQNDRRGRKDIG